MKSFHLLTLAVTTATIFFSCKKSNDEITSPVTIANDTTHAKKGIAESNYKLVLQTDKRTIPDKTQPGFVMKDTSIYYLIDINIRLRVDSETRKAYYVKQGLTGKNDTLLIVDSSYLYFYGKPYYGMSVFSGNDLVSQSVDLKGDSIFIYQGYMVGNIGASSTYKGYKIP